MFTKLTDMSKATIFSVLVLFLAVGAADLAIKCGFSVTLGAALA